MALYKSRTAKPTTGLSVQSGGPSVATRVAKTSNTTRMATQMGVLGAGGDVIVFTMANSSGATATYVIGDADGAVALQLGKTVVNPTSTNVFSPAVLKSRFATRPVQVVGMNLQTSSTAAEFAQNFQYGWVENDGSASIKPLPIGVFASPSDQNDLIRPVDFAGFSKQVVLGPDSGLFLPVLNGETLTAYIVMGAQTV